MLCINLQRNIYPYKIKRRNIVQIHLFLDDRLGNRSQSALRTRYKLICVRIEAPRWQAQNI